jgi:hypothetical protein
MLLFAVAAEDLQPGYVIVTPLNLRKEVVRVLGRVGNLVDVRVRYVGEDRERTERFVRSHRVDVQSQ